MRPTNSQPAFTLLEMVAVFAVMAALAAIALPAVGVQIAQVRIATESRELKSLADAVRASFTSTDLESTNLAALSGTVPSGVDATAFSVSTDVSLLPATTNTNDWFAKIARQLGDTPVVGQPPSWSAQPRLARVIQNANHLTRILLVGPTNEPGQQRFLLLSLVAAPGRLTLPAWPNPQNNQDTQNLAYFNDVWNTDWTSVGAALPSTWTQSLAAAQLAAWTSGSGSLWQLCVERIVCSKFTLTINNSHPTSSLSVYYNFNGSTAGIETDVAASAGVVSVPSILAGRIIRAYLNTGTGSPTLFAQFALRDNAEITLQD